MRPDGDGRSLCDIKSVFAVTWRSNRVYHIFTELKLVAGEHAARVLRSMLPLRLQAANWAVSDSLAGDDGDVADRALWLEHGHRTYVLAHTALVQEEDVVHQE